MKLSFIGTSQTYIIKKNGCFELNADIKNMCRVIDKICCRELFKSV